MFIVILLDRMLNQKKNTKFPFCKKIYKYMDNFEHHYSLTNKDSKNKKFAPKCLIMFENYLVEN